MNSQSSTRCANRSFGDLTIVAKTDPLTGPILSKVLSIDLYLICLELTYLIIWPSLFTSTSDSL